MNGTATKSIEDLWTIPGNRQSVRRLVESMKTSTVVPFVGAGLSIPLGYPGWKGFLERLAEQFKIEDKVSLLLEQQDFEGAADEIVRTIGANNMNVQIDDAFGERTIPPGYVGLLARFPSLFQGVVITTNFDHALELFYRARGSSFPHVYTGQDAEKAIQKVLNKERVLIKLHGDIDYVGGRMLSREDYNSYYGTDKVDEQLPLPQLLRQLTSSHCLLFIGCSLATDRTLSILHETAKDIRFVPRFAIVEQPADEGAWQRKTKLLSEHNIRPIWYPEGQHEYVDAILRHLPEAVEQPSTAEPPAGPLKKWTVAAIYSALGLALLAAQLADWRFGPGFVDKKELSIGILLRSSWEQDAARRAFERLLAELDTSLAAVEGGYDTGTQAPRLFDTFEAASAAMRRGEIDIIGELSPRQIHLAQRTGAVPFISPMYENSVAYESVVVVGDWWLEKNGERPAHDPWIKPALWHKVVEGAKDPHALQRIALMQDTSTSGYWYPRKLILQELGGTARLTDVLVDASSLFQKEEDLLGEVASPSGSGFAGAVASFRLERSRHEGELTIVQRIPMIPNGAFVIRKELAGNELLVKTLKENWENSVQQLYRNALDAPTEAGGGGFDPRPYFPARWAAVDLSHYRTAFEVFDLVDPVEAEKRRQVVRFFIAGSTLLVALCAAGLVVRRGSSSGRRA